MTKRKAQLAKKSKDSKRKRASRKTSSEDQLNLDFLPILTLLTLVHSNSSSDDSGQYYISVGQKLYHENQRSSLCGQHAINSALQGPIFSQHELNKIADDLFTQEKEIRYNETLKRNPFCDEFGNYSIYVIQEALSKTIWFGTNESDLFALSGKAF